MVEERSQMGASTSYYRARYYDPQTGRFLGEDPLQFGGEISFYRYVENNPVLLIDPFGLSSQIFNRTNNTPTSCIRGLRITVYDVLEYLASGMSHADILRELPYLTEEDIRACLAYAADREHKLEISNA